MKSLSVNPSILCVQIFTPTFPHARKISGWWPCASAVAPILFTNPSAVLKSGNAKSFSIWCSFVTVQWSTWAASGWIWSAVKGGTPSGELWEAYKTNLIVDAQMLRLVAMPPDSPPAAIAALRQALIALNDDADYAADAMTAMQFVPHYEVSANLDQTVRDRLTIAPEMRSFITGYMKKVAK